MGSPYWLGKDVVPHFVPHLEFYVRGFLVIAGLSCFITFVQVLLDKGKGGPQVGF